VRAGTLRHLDLFGLAGIVTFPSFHAASAVLYAWALWPVRWIRPIAVAANGAMFASTPIDEGHYFSGLAAGVAVALVSIAVARRLSREPSQSRAAGDDVAPFGGTAARATPAE
jgi:hypothetical protein